MPGDPAHVRREHVEAFITFLLERYKPATASNRYRGLQAFFRWCVEEGELKASPMAKMSPPHVPETPPDVLSDAELTRLLRAYPVRASRNDATQPSSGCSSTPVVGCPKSPASTSRTWTSSRT